MLQLPWITPWHLPAADPANVTMARCGFRQRCQVARRSARAPEHGPEHAFSSWRCAKSSYQSRRLFFNYIPSCASCLHHFGSLVPGIATSAARQADKGVVEADSVATSRKLALSWQRFYALAVCVFELYVVLVHRCFF